MLSQGYITQAQYDVAIAAPLPTATDIQAPELTTEGGYNTGYFDDWVQEQVIDRYGAQRAFEGGLRVTTSLDLQLQKAAEDSINAYLPDPAGPTAALVAIDNQTGQVKAMVGGRNYDTSPFNLATQGERQPGSAFKAFDLAAALGDGISPGSVWPSHPLTLRDPHGGVFVVRNDESTYAGSNTLAAATALSDNTVYAQVGVHVGTHRIAGLAHRMGITTPVSTNYAMTIGGLSTGVTVLDMAHAYETIATGGRRVSGSLVAGAPLNSYSAVGIEKVKFPGGRIQVDEPVSRRVLSPSVAATETSMLEAVITSGTGTNAAIGSFAAGKTGTTSNYADAWFVGWNSKYTVAVWVGYPTKLVPMRTDYGGSPVLGGTFPALIWRNFMLSAIAIGQNQGSSSTTSSSGAIATGRDRRRIRWRWILRILLDLDRAATVAEEPGHRRQRRRGRREQRDSGAGERPGGSANHWRRPGNGGARAERTGPGERAGRRRRRRRRGWRQRHAGLGRRRRRPCGLRRRRGGYGLAPSARRLRARRARHGRERRTRARHVGMPLEREAPRQVDRLRDPHPHTDAYARRLPSGRAGMQPHRADREVDPVVGERDGERLGELAGSGAQLTLVGATASFAHALQSGERLQRPDEDRGGGALGLADDVEHRVDSVGAIHVGGAGRTEQRPRPSGATDVGVAGRLGLVVGLDLDDHPADPVALDDAAKEIRGHIEHRTRVERVGQRTRRTHAQAAAPTAARARASCSSTRASDVPPSETLDSSHERCSSTV